MRDLLVVATEYAVILIDGIALFIIVVATLQAFIAGLPAIFSPLAGTDRRDIWLRYARWLVAGLSFQLAADIIESATTTSWDSIGRLAAIAVIRTFLNYFLDRDLEAVRERQREAERAAKA